MLTRRCLVGLVGLVLVFWSLSTALGQDWEVVYPMDGGIQDFSSEPTEWVTNNSARYYWRDSPHEDYHLYMVKNTGEYAYTPLDFNTHDAFKLEFDIIVHSLSYAGDACFGLWDTTLSYRDGSNVRVTYVVGDRGKLLEFGWLGMDGVGRESERLYPADWAYNQWYHNVLEYNPSTGRARLIVSTGKGEGGPVYADLAMDGLLGDARLDPAATLLGSSAIGPYANPGATADYEIDNVALSVLRSVIAVSIDIKPGSFPNSVNLGSNGVVPVAVLSSADFDATTVDPDTVTLAGAGVAVRGKGSKYMAREEDVDGDGDVDLVCQVETENLDPDSLQDGEAILTGQTYDGEEIEGKDLIRIVPE